MLDFSLLEAQLFRLLVGFFGRDHVVPRMRVIAVCGGELNKEFAAPVRAWAESNSCLFTVVDRDDTPKLVVEFFEGFDEFVDAREEEHQRLLPRLLESAGIRYVTFSEAELSEVMDPEGGVDFYHLLRSKFEGLDPSVPEAEG